MAVEEHDPLIQDAMDKYPPVDVLNCLPSSPYNNSSSLLDDLPSVPKHMPQKAQSSPQTPPPPPPPPQGFMKMPEPLSNRPPLGRKLQQKPQGIQLPTPSDFPLPHTTVVDPSQLASWIVKRQNVSQPSVLILDVRPRQVFDQGFIKHRWIAQIEPLVLKQK